MDEPDMRANKNAHRWYIAYTLPRHEKSIASRLRSEQIPCYVPLYSETRTCRHRRVDLELPLFPCYVFVKMLLENRTRLLSVCGVVRLLTLNGTAGVFSDEEMDALQASLKQWGAQPFPFHCPGKRIRIQKGPFAGLEGTILRRNGKRKLVVTLDIINSSMLLDVDVTDALCVRSEVPLLRDLD